MMYTWARPTAVATRAAHRERGSKHSGKGHDPSRTHVVWLTLGSSGTKQVYLQIPDYGKVQTTIDTLHGSCRLADGSDDPAKGNQLLEVYGITIQLCTATNNNALMKQVRLFFSCRVGQVRS